MSRCELPLQKGRPMLPVWKQKNSTLSSLLPLSFISFNTSTINTCRHPSCFSVDSRPPFSILAHSCWLCVVSLKSHRSSATFLSAEPWCICATPQSPQNGIGGGEFLEPGTPRTYTWNLWTWILDSDSGWPASVCTPTTWLSSDIDPFFLKATQPPWLAHVVFRTRSFSFICYYISSMFQKIPLDSNQLLVTMALGVVVVSCVLCLGIFNAHRGWSWSYPFSWMPTTAKKRHTPTSKTPSESLTPTEKLQSNGNSPVKSKELSSEEKKPSPPLLTIDYRDIFPPSCREALLKTAEKLPLARRQAIRAGQIDQAEFRKDVMSMSANYRECGLSSFTPTGISVEEINALQDFPDYAELSGVPLPKSYEEFKIEAALPRPYRPFRWVYHQTMCTSLLSHFFMLETADSNP